VAWPTSLPTNLILRVASRLPTVLIQSMDDSHPDLGCVACPWSPRLSIRSPKRVKPPRLTALTTPWSPSVDPLWVTALTTLPARPPPLSNRVDNEVHGTVFWDQHQSPPTSPPLERVTPVDPHHDAVSRPLHHDLSDGPDLEHHEASRRNRDLILAANRSDRELLGE